jgi:hypothetical protein
MTIETETTVVLKRVEFDKPGMPNFCFEIEAQKLGVAFTLTVPTPSSELHQMWETAHVLLASILHSAAKEAATVAAGYAPSMTKEEELLRRIFGEPPRPDLPPDLRGWKRPGTDSPD